LIRALTEPPNCVGSSAGSSSIDAGVPTGGAFAGPSENAYKSSTPAP
jgi:hypothetical protein